MTHLPQGWYLQQWQYGQPTAAERNIDEAIALALQYKAAGIAEKVMDGTTWMGQVAAGSPKSYADVERNVAKCRDAGLVYLPWTNPLNKGRAFLATQAEYYAAIGRIAGFMVWDSEPYDQFWGANRPAGDASFMLDIFRSNAPDCVNVWQPDPRPGRLAELRPAEWAPHMNVYAPQTYWTDFQTDPRSEINRAAQQARSMGIAECAPTVPTNGDAMLLPVAIDAMAMNGIVSTIAWRMGTADAGHLTALRDLAGHVPEEPDPHAACKAGIDKAIAELTALRESLP